MNWIDSDGFEMLSRKRLGADKASGGVKGLICFLIDTQGSCLYTTPTQKGVLLPLLILGYFWPVDPLGTPKRTLGRSRQRVENWPERHRERYSPGDEVKE